MKEFEQQEKMRKAVSDAQASVGPRPAETYASKSEVAELSNKMDAILAALAAKPKPGRPKKVEEPKAE
jgi:soluble cytochrome b562